jgi:hypothetical protein
MAAMPERSPLMSAANTGTPLARKLLGHGLQGHGLAGAGGAGDQPMAIGQLQGQHLSLVLLPSRMVPSGAERWFAIGRSFIIATGLLRQI